MKIGVLEILLDLLAKNSFLEFPKFEKLQETATRQSFSAKQLCTAIFLDNLSAFLLFQTFFKLDRC
jgi:hypothetical protein